MHVTILKLQYSEGHNACECVLQAPGRTVEIGAAKSRWGHAEASAGAVGLCQALTRLNTVAVPSLLHLRHFNTHLQPLFGAAKAPKLTIPREAAPGIQSHHAGISSFAFQVIALTNHVTAHPSAR